MVDDVIVISGSGIVNRGKNILDKLALYMNYSTIVVIRISLSRRSVEEDV